MQLLSDCTSAVVSLYGEVFQYLPDLVLPAWPSRTGRMFAFLTLSLIFGSLYLCKQTLHQKTVIPKDAHFNCLICVFHFWPPVEARNRDPSIDSGTCTFLGEGYMYPRWEGGEGSAYAAQSPVLIRVGNGISFRKNSAEWTWNDFRYSAEESAHSEPFWFPRKSQFRSSERNGTERNSAEKVRFTKQPE
jgi:hypothetical protein